MTFEDMFDEMERIELGHARHRIQRALLTLPFRPHWPAWVRYRGLARLVCRNETTCLPSVAPIGWRYERDLGFLRYILLPLWLYWPVALWDNRVPILFGPLVALGFWCVSEGGYYVEGRWNWKWWHHVSWRNQRSDQSRWERIGWWIQSHVVDDWNDRMPQWSTE